MKKKHFVVILAGLALLFTFLISGHSAESASLDGTVSTAGFIGPKTITYKREFHKATGLTHTKYYRHTRYGQSYSGYLTFQQMSGKNYAIYKGTLYLEGSNGGHIPIPSKFEPTELY